MKQLLSITVILFLATLLLCGCATTEERAARAAAKAAKVQTALAERQFKLSINRMYPLRGGTRQLSFGYSIEVRNDSLISYLPFFGRAYSVPYGGGKALNFSERIGSYQETLMADGLHHIEIGVKNEEDTYVYFLDVYDNGKATVDVQSYERDRISFSGTMELEE